MDRASIADHLLRAEAEIFNVVEHGVPVDGTDALPALDRLVRTRMRADDYLYIPAGVTVDVGGAFAPARRVHIRGGGKLRLRARSTLADQVLELAHDGSSVAGIDIDANQANSPRNRGRGEGLRITGQRCLAVNLRVYDTRLHAAGNGVFVPGNNNHIENVTSLRAGYACFRNDGSGNIYRNITARDWQLGKGFVHNGAADRLEIDGFDATSSVDYQTRAGREALLLDAGGRSRLRYARLRRLNIDGPNRALRGGNAVKFACLDELDVEDSVLSHTIAEIVTVRVAEAVGTVRFHNTVIGRNIIFSNIATESATFTACVIGDGRSPAAVRAVIPNRLRRLRLLSSRIARFTEAVYRDEALDREIERREISDCELAALSDDVAYVETRARNKGVRTTGKIIYLRNRLSQAGTGRVTLTPAIATSNLFSTIDASGRVFRLHSAPRDNIIRYEVGDRFYYPEPRPSGFVGEICVRAGAPAEWRPFRSGER